MIPAPGGTNKTLWNVRGDSDSAAGAGDCRGTNGLRVERFTGTTDPIDAGNERADLQPGRSPSNFNRRESHPAQPAPVPLASQETRQIAQRRSCRGGGRWAVGDREHCGSVDAQVLCDGEESGGFHALRSVPERAAPGDLGGHLPVHGARLLLFTDSAPPPRREPGRPGAWASRGGHKPAAVRIRYIWVGRSTELAAASSATSGSGSPSSRSSNTCVTLG